MKKSAYILIAFAFAAAVSCVKEIAAPQEPETCTLTAEFADGDVETRTSITSDNKTRWTLDDKILIQGSDGTITGTATSLQDNGRVAIFTMSNPVSSSGLYASYPSNLVYPKENQHALWLSNTQSGSFAKANLSFGKVNGSSIKFKNATAIFRFNVSESKVDKVKIGCTSTFLGGFYIAPTFNSNGTIASIKELETPSNSLPITVSTPEPGAYYVAVRPGTYSANTIYFEFYDAAGNSILKYTYPKSLNAARGKLVDWGDISNKGEVPVLGVSLDKTSMEMDLYTSKQLTATITPENATNKGLTWTSLNSNVASVDNKGLVTAWKEGSTTIIVNTKDGNKKASCTVTVKKDGLLPGVFSVSATKKVKFSKGNLYWDGSAFYFEAKQYDVQSSWNASHVSHFYWSESASVAYAKEYNDESTSLNEVFFTNATGETAKSDFTVDGLTGQFRTLTVSELIYLLNTRTVNGGTGKEHSFSINITYGGKKGLVLYPDDYNKDPISGTVTELPIGVVFLPEAGYRSGSNFYEFGDSGTYWSASTNDGLYSYRLFFFNEIASPSHIVKRDNGCCVRLVTDIK